MTAKEQGLLRECFSCGTIHGGALCCGPIERDPKMERDYIPMPGGWEIQTKGKGSTFRICDKDGDRLAIPDSPYLHETLERMAREVNAAALASDTGERGVADEVWQLQRWAMAKGSDGERWSVYMDHDDAGEWVKWSHVQQALLVSALRAQPAGGDSCGTCGAPVGERGEYAVHSEKAWAEGYRSGVDDERISEANIGIAGFDAKVEPARVNPYRATPPESGGQGAVAWRSKMPGDTVWLITVHEPTPPGIIKQPLYTHPPAQASGAVTEEQALQEIIRHWGAASVRAALDSLTQGGGNGR